LPRVYGAAVIKLDRPLPAGSAANGKRPTRRVAIRAEYRKSRKRIATGLLGLAGGGVYPADDVTTVAVRSYRTISPLPVPEGHRLCIFCGTFPRVAPGGR